jgi:hypothetical protein
LHAIHLVRDIQIKQQKPLHSNIVFHAPPFNLQSTSEQEDSHPDVQYDPIQHHAQSRLWPSH